MSDFGPNRRRAFAPVSSEAIKMFLEKLVDSNIRVDGQAEPYFHDLGKFTRFLTSDEIEVWTSCVLRGYLRDGYPTQRALAFLREMETQKRFVYGTLIEDDAHTGRYLVTDIGLTGYLCKNVITGENVVIHFEDAADPDYSRSLKMILVWASILVGK